MDHTERINRSYCTDTPMVQIVVQLDSPSYETQTLLMLFKRVQAAVGVWYCHVSTSGVP